jgi:hypothetical protein
MPLVSNGRKQRIKFESKCLAPKRVKFNQKDIRFFFFEKSEKLFLPLFFYPVQGYVHLRIEKPFKIGIHLQLGKPNNPDMFRDIRFNMRSATDQKNPVALQRFTNFKGSEQVSDPQYMLTVKNDLHRLSNFDEFVKS